MRPEPLEAATTPPASAVPDGPDSRSRKSRTARQPRTPPTADGRSRGGRAVLAGATVAYLGFVAWLTLTPQPYDPDAVPLLDRVLALLRGFPPTAWITFDVVEFSANVALFVPLAVLLLLLLGPSRRWLVLALAVALTCSIELAQAAWLPTRVSDPRDVVANTSGAVLGVALVLTARRAGRRGRPRGRPLPGDGRRRA